METGTKVLQTTYDPETFSMTGTRRGTVVRIYRSRPSATDKGIEMADVEWEDGAVTVGHITQYLARANA